MGFLCFSLILYALLCVLSSFAIILKKKKELVTLFLLSSRCLVTVYVLWLFLTVPWVGLQCMVVEIPDHTHLFFIFICRLLKTHTHIHCIYMH